ncbi:hypothetical protein IP88_04160 [alpha proteobacterium AAP81b]|nr:hypothetical protein IP88_04160 [alpha proteobacterium AAP81b]
MRGLVEGDIKAGLQNGGHLRSVFVVCRVVDDQLEHAAYIRTSWFDEYLPLRTYGHRSDRTYRDLDRLLELLRLEFDYLGPITLYASGDPLLGSFGSLAADDCQPFVPPRKKAP